jgi:transcription elongation factor GreB
MPREDEELDFGGEEEEVPLPRGKIYITRQGAERLHAELKQLVTVERPKVTSEVSAAAAQGDRSENAEYIYGKKRLREIDRRLHFLQKRLAAVTIVEPTEQKDTSKVFFGATVTLENEEDRSSVTYQLVGPDETDAKAGKISVDSPIGKALLGRRGGDSVTVVRPKGEADFTIIGIKYV